MLGCFWGPLCSAVRANNNGMRERDCSGTPKAVAVCPPLFLFFRLVQRVVAEAGALECYSHASCLRAATTPGARALKRWLLEAAYELGRHCEKICRLNRALQELKSHVQFRFVRPGADHRDTVEKHR